MNNSLLQRIRRSRESYLLMLPYLLFFTVFTLIPVIVAIVISFNRGHYRPGQLHPVLLHCLGHQ